MAKISEFIKNAFLFYAFEKEFVKNKRTTDDLSWLKEDPSYDDAFGTVKLDIQYILEGSVKLHTHIDLDTFLNDKDFCSDFEIPSDRELAKKELIKLFEDPKTLIGEYELLDEILDWDEYIGQPESYPDFDEDGPKNWKPDPRRNYDLKSGDYSLTFEKKDAKFIGDRLEIFYEWYYE